MALMDVRVWASFLLLAVGCSEVTVSSDCDLRTYNDCIGAAFNAEQTPADCSAKQGCDLAACQAASSAAGDYAVAEATRACDDPQPACAAVSPTWYFECVADCKQAAAECMADADVCTGCAGERNECLDRC